MDRCRLAFRGRSSSQPTTTFMPPSSIHHLHAELAVAGLCSDFTHAVGPSLSAAAPPGGLRVQAVEKAPWIGLRSKASRRTVANSSNSLCRGSPALSVPRPRRCRASSGSRPLRKTAAGSRSTAPSWNSADVWNEAGFGTRRVMERDEAWKEAEPGTRRSLSSGQGRRNTIARAARQRSPQSD